MSKVNKFIETESEMVAARGWWEKKMGSCPAMDIKFQLHKVNKFKKSTSANIVPIVNNTVIMNLLRCKSHASVLTTI